MMSDALRTSHILGFARIGFNRELKFALEKYWKSPTEENERLILQVRERVCYQNWKAQKLLGLDYLSVGDFAFYDHVLSALMLVGGLPGRFGVSDTNQLATYFEAARGNDSCRAMEMKKWFNTNYHYMVPEYGADSTFRVNIKWLIEEVDLATLLSHPIKVNVLGPVTLLWLGREQLGLVNRIELLPRLLEVYKEILLELKSKKVDLIQIEEPVSCLDVPAVWEEAITLTYHYLPRYSQKMLFTTYFVAPKETSSYIFRLPVAGVHIDITSGFNFSVLSHCRNNSVLSVGVVNGRNIWRNDIDKSVYKVGKIQGALKVRVILWVATSCSLLHTPCDLTMEERIRRDIRRDMSFGVQKIREVVSIKLAFESEPKNTTQPRTERAFNPRVGFCTEELTDNFSHTRSSYDERRHQQHETLTLPIFPTTTVGSFPQTPQIRSLRAKFRENKISRNAYIINIRKEISYIIAKQASYDLDVLVHGEVERNDMVEYFGELLEGFVITRNGWIQSYGSRCTKPPVIFSDIAFVAPMSLYWFNHAQSLTTKPVKGMITGPTTMLNWSFAREDLPYQEMSLQLGNALRVELSQLVRSGVRVVQIDEPAIKEGLPLDKISCWYYLNWVARAFNALLSKLSNKIQVHTHICYSELEDLMPAIAKLDVDVISAEAARSNMLTLESFSNHGYKRGMGLGLYDIHSPATPSTIDIISKVQRVIALVPRELIWINPDCGLKTRTWSQVDAALVNLVEAAKRLRDTYRDK